VLDWWRRVKDSPRARYNQQRRLGATEELALDVVAESYGLTVNVVRLGTDGSEKIGRIRWSIKDLDRLLYWRWAYQTGHLTEPETEP
jgi:hypothetical protein